MRPIFVSTYIYCIPLRSVRLSTHSLWAAPFFISPFFAEAKNRAIKSYDKVKIKWQNNAVANHGLSIWWPAATARTRAHLSKNSTYLSHRLLNTPLTQDTLTRVYERLEYTNPPRTNGSSSAAGAPSPCSSSWCPTKLQPQSLPPFFGWDPLVASRERHPRIIQRTVIFPENNHSMWNWANILIQWTSAWKFILLNKPQASSIHLSCMSTLNDLSYSFISRRLTSDEPFKMFGTYVTNTKSRS